MLETLLVTKGHPYEREPFYAMFDGMRDVNWTLAEQPAAQALFSVEQAEQFDAFVCYDMPGIQFDRIAGNPPHFFEPPERYKQRFMELVDHGHGFVFLHHAIAGWPVGRFGRSLRNCWAVAFCTCRLRSEVNSVRTQVTDTRSPTRSAPYPITRYLKRYREALK